MLDFILFIMFLSIFFILMFFINIDFGLPDLFLWAILWNKIWQFIIVWIGVFIFGKKIIDQSEINEKNNLSDKK